MQMWEDKENPSTSSSSFLRDTPRPRRALTPLKPSSSSNAARALPKLCLGEFQQPLYLDFRTVDVGSSKTLKFTIEVMPEAAESRAGNGAVTLQVDRAPKSVEVSLTDDAGSVTWTPEKGGMMREVILLRLNGRHRTQITIHGQALGGVADPVKKAGVAETPSRGRAREPSTDRRRPLRAISLPPPQSATEPAPSSAFEGRLSKLSSNFKALEEKLGGVLSTEQQEPNSTPLSIVIPAPAPHSFALDIEAVATPQVRGRSSTRRVDSVASPPRSFSLPPPSCRPPPATKAQVQSFRQERALTQWLNFVLSPPSVAQSMPHPADFIKQQRCDVRARARELYESETMAGIRLALEKEIAAKKLLVREDKDLHADLNLREAFIELLFSYQLPWLQIGLEAVLGIEVIKTAKRDGQIVRLSTASVLRKLIVQRVLSDPDTVSRAKGPSGRFGEAYRHQLRANTMRRFFSLVLFLDRAKREELLPTRRALFQPTAPAKSSSDVLLLFNKDYMSGEGNLLRHLASLGLTVSHVQTYLDELDFRTTSLAADLRDGVRLARLVDEMQQGKDPSTVCSLLRVPPISRLQKVHNVKVTLERLVRSAGIKRLKSVAPEDVVDGHREKTVTIIWEIIRHYNLEHMVASLSGINQFQALVRRRIMQRHYQRLRNLALVLQRLYRSRRVLIRCRGFPPRPVLILQSRWRAMVARGAFLRQRDAAVRIQSCARSTMQRRSFERKRSATVAIQAHARGFMRRLMRRRRWAYLRQCITTLQALWRGRAARASVSRQHDAAIMMQKTWRLHVALQHFTRLRSSTLQLQALARGAQARRRLRLQVLCIRTIQQAIRGYVTRKVQRTTRLQALWRGRAVRKSYSKMHAAATTIAKQWRGHHAMGKYRTSLAAAIKLQSFARAAAGRQHYRALLWKRLEAATVVQQLWRGSHTRLQLRRAGEAAVVIQARWRCAAARSAYLHQRAAAIKLQALARSRIISCHYQKSRCAQLALARVWRGHAVRVELRRQQVSAITIQRHVKGRLARKNFDKSMASIVVLQSHARRMLARNEYKQTIVRIVHIQSYQRRRAAIYKTRSLRLAGTVYRLRQGYLARRQVRAWNAASTTLQRMWRGARVRLANSRAKAATVLQQHWRGAALRLRMTRLVRVVVAAQRGTRRMLRQREARAHEAATVIARTWRGATIRGRVALWKTNAVTVQRTWRGATTRAAYRHQLALIVRLQAWARGSCLRHQLVRSQHGATLLQAHVRGFCVRKAVARAQAASCLIQSHARRWLAVKSFRHAQYAIITLQSTARRTLAVRRYRRAVQACMTMQRCWRMVMDTRAKARVARATMIQCVWRGKLARAGFQSIKSAAVTIQAAVRSSICRRKFLATYRQIVLVQSQARLMLTRKTLAAWHKAAFVIQAAIRAYLYRSKQLQHAAATHVQRIWRGRAARAVIAAHAAAATRIQAVVRGRSELQAYQATRRSIIILQSYGRMVPCRSGLRRAKKAIVVLQRMARGAIARREIKSWSTAAVQVQSLWRGARVRQAERRRAAAATIIQSAVRAHTTRAWYLTVRSRFIRVQAITRGNCTRQTMQVKACSAIAVQRIWRGHHQVRLYAATVQAIRVMQRWVRERLTARRWKGAVAAVTVLQRLFRVRRLVRAMAAHRGAVIKVQSLWRGRSTRRQVQKLQAATIVLQALTRGRRARKRFLAWKKGINGAQALVRAWLVRRRAGAKLRALRAKVKAANQRADADPSLQIGNRHRAALDILLNSKSCSHILKCCVTLEISTRLSRLCCEALVDANGMEKLFSLIRSCNRSTPHMELLRHVLRVLQNVAAYDHLVASISEVQQLVDTLIELLQNFREKDLYNTFMPAALLLLRVATTCPSSQMEVSTADVQRRLTSILRLLQRKADQERASKSTRWHKASDRDITVLRPIQVLQRLVLPPPTHHHHRDY